MKLLKTFVFIFFLSLLWNTTEAQKNYYPLKKGQVIIYKYGSFFNRGDDALRFKLEVSNENKSENGKEYMIVESSYGSEEKYEVVNTVYMRIGENGSVINLETTQGAQEQIFLEHPIVVGKTWEQEANGKRSTVEVVALDGSVKTPNKTFTNCLVLEGSDEEMKTRIYLLENVGMVATTVFLEAEEKLMIYMED